MMGALADQLGQTNMYPRITLLGCVARPQTMSQNPWQIIAMHDTKDQRLLWIETATVVIWRRPGSPVLCLVAWQSM